MLISAGPLSAMASFSPAAATATEWLLEDTTTLLVLLEKARGMREAGHCERVKLTGSPNCLGAKRYPCPSCATLVAFDAALAEAVKETT